MTKLNLGAGALSGALLTITLMAVMFLADELAGLSFAPFDLFDWVSRVLPGPVVIFGIELMIDTLGALGLNVATTAKTAERTLAVLQFFSLGVVAGGVFFVVAGVRDGRPDRLAGILAGVIAGLPLMAISIAIGDASIQPVLVIVWLSALSIVWGMALRWTYIRLIPAEAPVESSDAPVRAVQALDRRQFLIRLGAATATITVASSGLGSLLAQAARREIELELATSMAHKSQGSPRDSFPNAGDPLMPAPGTRPEYTPVKDHYKVFIRSRPTVINGANWSLPIMGLVENPMSLTLDDFENNYEVRRQYVTLSCISGRIGTTLISTTQWGGVSLQDILADVKPTTDARYLHITSGDGFYETVDMDLIASDERVMLCYEWDGNYIPIDHGFPLRIWIPDLYGMKQPKWITGINVMKDLKQGYWVERGWDEVARVEAVSVIDTVAVDAAYENNGRQLVPVGGIAFAGARGVSGVQVSVDDGPWQDASLRSPLSNTTWVIWRFDWPFSAGDHSFEVRCAERDGTPQIETNRGNHPSGATGLHKRTI